MISINPIIPEHFEHNFSSSYAHTSKLIWGTKTQGYLIYYVRVNLSTQAKYELNPVAMETTSLKWQNNYCHGNYFQIKIWFSQYNCHIIIHVIDTTNSSQVFCYEQLLKIWWSLMKKLVFGSNSIYCGEIELWPLFHQCHWWGKQPKQAVTN